MAPALKTGVRVPLSFIDPFLDRIHKVLIKRVTEADLEMSLSGSAAHEITAGCYRQASEFAELRRRMQTF